MTEGDQRELISRILGDAEGMAFDRLDPAVFSELRQLAHNQMRNERAGNTLQPTALVNEAYLRLVDESRVGERGRRYFFGAAARAMRQILIERARARKAQKRGGDAQRISLVPDVAGTSEPDIDVLALEEALTELKELDPRQAEVVELRFYGGLSVKEVADYFGVSDRTIKTDWQIARAWLRRRLEQGSAED